MNRLLTKDKLIDQATGLAFGVGVAVLLAVGIEVYDKVQGAPDMALLDLAFWSKVGAGVAVTAIRSTVTALGTVLGLTIKGVSSA